MDTLVREDVSGTLDVDKQFAKACAEKLGYTQLRSVNGDHKLLARLHELGLDPFTPESVRRYQWKQVLRANFSKSVPWMLSAVVWLSVSLLTAWALKNAGLHPLAGVPVIIVCVMCIVVSAAMAATNTDLHRWEVAYLRYYSRPVPEFVLQTALDVHETCPNVDFYVDYLERTGSKIVMDPFLRIDTDTGRYYVEVWDEPRYKQERKA